jgi:hypothetical protein
MNINQIISNALSSMDVPVWPNHYDGNASAYIIFNYADERPETYADDEDILDETSIQVHLYTKSDPQADKKKIRRLLRAAGFSITGTQEFYEDDTKFNHIVIEAWIEGAVDD